MAERDYYEVLGINKGASDDDIRKAYRGLAKQHHPDANLGKEKEAEEKFKEISKAYSVLSDSEKRASYDRFGHQAFDGSMGGAGYSGNMDFNMHDIFSSVFGDFFGGGGGRRGGDRGPSRGPDVQVQIQVTFQEAVVGTERELSLNLHDKCTTCNGSGAKPGTYPESCKHCGGRGEEVVTQQTMFGRMQSVRPCAVCRGEGRIIKTPCQTCSGQGKVKANKKIIVSIPKGIDNGQSIRIPEKGEAGERGGPPGDLRVLVYVKADTRFRRDGVTLFTEISVDMIRATLGGTIKIPTPYGETDYDIKPGTQPGTVVTLKNKGMPNVHNPNRVGDLEANIKVVIPIKLTVKQEELLREFNDEPTPAEKKRFGKKK
ncbi:MAG: molecular chaperone DnaJ [Defluviitaleaceae bacterium]|nr:molecular chaperone DnaJ [Defluviitaleaceae bacterium]